MSTSTINIAEQISNYLGLDTLDQKEQIVNDLLQNGRQMFRKYEKFVSPEIFLAETSEANSLNEHGDSPLLSLIKQHIMNQWELSLQSLSPVLLFINRTKEECFDHFNRVLQTTAETGGTSAPILLILIQLIFQTLDPAADKNVLNEIFNSLTTDGIQSLRKFANYIAGEDLEEQLSSYESPIFLSLLLYNNDQIPALLKKHKIPNTRDLYKLAIHSVTKSGLLIGLESVRAKIAPISYKSLTESLRDDKPPLQLTTEVAQPQIELVSLANVSVPSNEPISSYSSDPPDEATPVLSILTSAEPMTVRKSETPSSTTISPVHSGNTPLLPTASQSSANDKSIPQADRIQTIDQMVTQCLVDLKAVCRNNERQSVCIDLSVSVEDCLKHPYLTLNDYNVVRTITSKIKVAEDAAEGDASVYQYVKRLQILVTEALYLRKVALANLIDSYSKRNVSVFLFGGQPLTVSRINRRFYLWSLLYHEDKVKFSKPEDLPLFKKIFLLIVQIKSEALSKITAEVGNSSYAPYFTKIGYKFWRKAVWVKNARKPGCVKPDELLNYTDLELGELQKTYAYRAYENYFEACKALKGIDAPKQKIELRKNMALSLYLTGSSIYLFEAQIFTIAAIYILARENGELQNELFSELQDVLRKIQRKETGHTEQNTQDSTQTASTNTAETMQLQPKLCRQLSTQNENVRQTQILNNVHSDLRAILLKSCMMKGTHCKVNTSESEILKAKVHSKLNMMKAAIFASSGLSMGAIAVTEAFKDVLTVFTASAVAGPSVVLIGGCVLGVVATAWLAYVFVERGIESAREPAIREKLNRIVAHALDCLNEDRIEDFLETLASNYAVNEKKEVKQLFKIEEIGKEIVLTLEANKIITELLSHEFRPDGIAYLLILIGESLLKGPKLLKKNRLPGYEIPPSSFNTIATDIFKKVYLSEELSEKAKSLDDKVIKSQLKEKADFLQTIWSSLQIEIGHSLYAIPREYFHDSEQPKPYTSRLKELCCIARINYAIANIIEARPENLEIGRQTVEDLKRDLEIGVGNQFFEISEIRIQAMENLLAAFDYGVGSDYEGGTRVTPAYERQWAFLETAVVLENISLLARADGSKLACEKPVLVSEKTMALELLETVLASVPGLNLRSVLKELRKPREEPILFDHRNLKRISDLCGLTFQTCCVKTDANVGHVFTLLDAPIGAIADSSIPHVHAVLETQNSVKTVVAAFILSNPTINEIVDRLNAETNEEIKAGLSNEIARHYRNEADQLDLKHHLLALPKWHKALKFYSDANDLCPTNRTAILGQVRCLIALNRYKKAKKLLSNNHSQVLECDEFYSLLALTNRRMRNYADASFNLQKATDLGLGNRAERKVLEAFKERQIIKKRVEFYRNNSVTKNCKKDGFKPYNILTVDGGGVRGLIPAVWLSELERRAGRSCSSLFHMMAGTSTGAIIVAGLSTPDLDNVQVPRYKASEILELYSEKASNIFTSSLSPISKIYQVLSHSPKYSDSGRRTLFELYFGKTLFSKSLTDLVIPTVKSGTNGSVIFSSRDIGKDPLTRNFTMKDVLMCTTAAPTFFPPHSLGNTLYIDGGVQANNPTMIAYVKAIKDYEIPRDDIFTWSLGTGDYVPNELDPAANRDLLFWIANREEIPKVIFDGPMNNIDQQMYGLLNEGRYNRWQVWLEDRVALDAYNEKTLELLFDIAKEHYEVLDAYDDSRRLGVVIERLRGEIA